MEIPARLIIHTDPNSGWFNSILMAEVDLAPSNSLIDLNFSLKEFKEYSHDMGGAHVYLEGKVPLSYHLWATKNWYVA